MLQNFIILLIIIITLYFTQMSHPISIGLILLCQTLLICLLIGIIYETFWFSYILYLIFLGGILILFIYVTAVASNETFSLSINLVLIIILYLILLMLFLLYDNTLINFLYNQLIEFSNKNSINLIKLFNYPTNIITILIINYLLITLIAIVKITNIFYGPLRQIFN